jgi:hypothetical protein
MIAWIFMKIVKNIRDWYGWDVNFWKNKCQEKQTLYRWKLLSKGFQKFVKWGMELRRLEEKDSNTVQSWLFKETAIILSCLLCIFIYCNVVLNKVSWKRSQITSSKVWCFHSKGCVSLNLTFILKDFFFGSTGVWTQGLTLTKQVLYHLNCSISHPLCFCILINLLILMRSFCF